MIRIVAVVASALLLVGCSALGSSSPPGPTASSAATGAATNAPTVGATPRPTPTRVPAAVVCPTASPLTVRQYVEADPACFEDVDVTIRGWLGAPPAIGWEPPYVAGFPYRIPEPGAIWSQGPGGDEMCAGDGVYCNWFFVYVAPDSELEIGAAHRWVVVTGHRMDPAAEGCYWDYGDGEVPAETNNPEIARSDCRTRYVLTGIADAPPD